MLVDLPLDISSSQKSNEAWRSEQGYPLPSPPFPSSCPHNLFLCRNLDSHVLNPTRKETPCESVCKKVNREIDSWNTLPGMKIEKIIFLLPTYCMYIICTWRKMQSVLLRTISHLCITRYVQCNVYAFVTENSI